MDILITGGAGYIGSHTALLLAQQGCRTIILDDFSQQQTFNPTWPAIVIKADCADRAVLTQIFTTYQISAILHFAGSTEVGLSIQDPLRFYDNNIVKTVQLLKIAREFGVMRIIFSSTCAVYGLPQYLPLTESHPCQPISPYGRTKYMIEQLLQDCATAYGLEYVILRYFNAAGAQPEFGLSEQHTPETHLIPLLLRAARQGTPFQIFGNDYDTPDGTCIRDYLHVTDLAQAHWLALKYLLAGANMPRIFNLGTGHGFSVLEVTRAIEQLTNTQLNLAYAPRRAGDPAVLIADATLAQQHLGWQPQHRSLPEILSGMI